MIKLLYRLIKECGLDIRKTTGVLKIPGYFCDLIKFRKQMKGKNHEKIILHPQLHDKTEKNGDTEGVYFRQDLLIASDIFVYNPEKHVDIGSSISGFVAHVASFREIEAFDIRPQDSIFNIKFKQMDLMEVPKEYKDYTDSISCLHALEHFGLGRYGDKLDVDGYKKGFKNILSMLKPNGTFYFSVPVGKEIIEFNAHRVFSEETIETLAKKNNLEIINYVRIGDKKFECGIWKFKKMGDRNEII